jgi:hypothetical protein
LAGPGLLSKDRDLQLVTKRGPEQYAAGGNAASLPGRILEFTVGLAVVAVAVQGIAHIVGAAAFDYSVRLIDADYDHSAFGWCSEVATFAGVPAALMLAALSPRRRPVLLFLAAVLCFLSLDDAVFIHERIAELDDDVGLGSSGGRLVWPVFYLPLLAATFAVVLAVARESSPRAARTLRTGLALLVAAVLLEASSYVLVRLGVGFREWPFAIEIVAEEGAELAGWILIAGALTAAAVLKLLESEPGSDGRVIPPS